MRVAVRDEERIVAEAAVAARGVGDVSVPQPFCDERQRVVGVAQVNDEAGVVSAAVAVIGEGGEQFAVVAGVAFAAVARRVDAGRAAECRHAQARVIGNGGQPADGGGMACLDERVFDEGRAGFRDLSDAKIALRLDMNVAGGEDGAEFADFFAVVTGQYDAVFHSPSACFCMSIISRMPCWASCIIACISSGRKA